MPPIINLKSCYEMRAENKYKVVVSKIVAESSGLLKQVYFFSLFILVPVRGHALITLRKLLETKNPEALEKQDLLLKVFQENMDHADSYIYLAAIQVSNCLFSVMVPYVVKGKGSFWFSINNFTT